MLPLFHVHGLVSGVLAALAAGSSVVCTPGFDAAAFFGWLKEFRPTWYTAVPAIHQAVLSAAGGDKRSAQRVLVAAYSLGLFVSAARRAGGLEALFGVPVIDTYGMTEAASQIAANPLDRRKPGSVGQPAGAEIAIMDSEGRRLPAGKRGEIALRGPTITRGYDNDAAATESAFRDGWFRTGDLGYLDEDGYLFIVGRIKDIINRGGQKVSPAEVEQALLSHPDVVEAAAFSIPHRRLGEDVAAAVVLRPDAKISAHRPPRLRPQTPGQVQGPWSDPHCAGDPERPRRKDQARRTRRRAFNNAAKGTSGTRRQVGCAPLGIGVATGQDLDGAPGVQSRSALTKTSSRSARIPLR